ncbi:hypothetical protein BUY81_14365, partial [Staphylococcus equorum]
YSYCFTSNLNLLLNGIAKIVNTKYTSNAVKELFNTNPMSIDIAILHIVSNPNNIICLTSL